MANQKALFERRKRRVRFTIATVSGGRPRLSVHRSGKHIYAQLIDDSKSATIASASSGETAKEGAKAKTYNIAAATVDGCGAWNRILANSRRLPASLHTTRRSCLPRRRS